MEWKTVSRLKCRWDEDGEKAGGRKSVLFCWFDQVVNQIVSKTLQFVVNVVVDAQRRCRMLLMNVVIKCVNGSMDGRSQRREQDVC
mmetsp:Transcript_15032/g.22032  ORF Transcript_15032/g.22032 Transcript_15032/m.22032 type:complete len:86 (-) Transcript_15032:52-309(-)